MKNVQNQTAVRYCAYCGKPIEAGKECTCEEAQASKSKRNLGQKKFIIIGVAAAIFVALVVGLSIGSKIDPFDYTTVTFDGYDTQGTVVVDFDKETLITGIIGECPDSFQEAFVWDEQYSDYSSSISYECSKEDGLSNGDKVTVTFTVTGAAENDVKSAKKNFKVEGLPEAKTIDFFENIEVYFHGLNGNAEALYKYKEESDMYKDCKFSFNRNYGLKNGDRITLTLSNLDEIADKYLCIPSSVSKEYIVCDLGEYATSAAQISTSTINDYADKFRVAQDAENAKSTEVVTYGKAEIYGVYFFYIKDEPEHITVDETNKLLIFVHAKQYVYGEFKRDVYTPLVFEDVVVNSDGTVDIKYEDGQNNFFVDDIDYYLNEQSADFAITSLTQ